MNKRNLQVIFKKYIDNFETLNNSENDETYKWEIAQAFQKFDVDAPDFAEMLMYFKAIPFFLSVALILPDRQWQTELGRFDLPVRRFLLPTLRIHRSLHLQAHRLPG